jgi:hypothetical protein
VTFWHLAEPDSLLFHNVFLGKGFYTTASVHAQIPGMEGIVTPYSVFHADKDKERYWEELRVKSFPQCVTRMKTLYAFTSQTDAENSNIAWFGGGRQVISLELAQGTVSIHDSRLLNGRTEDWANLALQYWSGAKSIDPLMEALLHGTLYFPGWEKPPFSFGVGFPKPPQS